MMDFCWRVKSTKNPSTSSSDKGEKWKALFVNVKRNLILKKISVQKLSLIRAPANIPLLNKILIIYNCYFHLEQGDGAIDGVLTEVVSSKFPSWSQSEFQIKNSFWIIRLPVYRVLQDRRDLQDYKVLPVSREIEVQMERKANQ